MSGRTTWPISAAAFWPLWTASGTRAWPTTSVPISPGRPWPGPCAPPMAGPGEVNCQQSNRPSNWDPAAHDRTYSPTQSRAAAFAAGPARQMVAETLLPDRFPPLSRWQRWRKPLILSGAVVLALAGGLIYFWFR